MSLKVASKDSFSARSRSLSFFDSSIPFDNFLIIFSPVSIWTWRRLTSVLLLSMSCQKRSLSYCISWLRDSNVQLSSYINLQTGFCHILPSGFSAFHPQHSLSLFEAPVPEHLQAILKHPQEKLLNK